MKSNNYVFQQNQTIVTQLINIKILST